MMRYNFNRRQIKIATGRSKKQQSNKNKKNIEDEVVATASKINTIRTKKFEMLSDEDNEIIRQVKLEKQRRIPKTWKDSWQKPLNESKMTEDLLDDSKIRTDTGSKRRNSKKSSYLADMINYE